MSMKHSESQPLLGAQSREEGQDAGSSKSPEGPSFKKSASVSRLRVDSEGSARGVSPIVCENDTSITVRRPLQYYSIGRQDTRTSHTERTQAQVHRYRYYSKLAPHSDSALLMPNHIVPVEFFNVIPVLIEGKQHSLITIFAIWNTMMGTSLLSMPWAVQQAGFATAICLMVVMAGITLYTAYRVMQSQNFSGSDTIVEFSDICRMYLGRWGEYLSIFFSILALMGATVVYWVLMSNFLYHVVSFIYEKANPTVNGTSIVTLNGSSHLDVYCPNPPFHQHNSSNSSELLWSMGTEATAGNQLFNKIWNQRNTVPFFLVILLMPLTMLRSPTFFTKFNALGTLSVVYIITFVSVKAAKWGFNMNFNPDSEYLYVKQFQPTFPALTGILALAYFIHNCVISIMRNQKNPENNGRDLSIAYICVALTYIFIGVVFYAAFPLAKECLEDNLLNNFRSSDVFAFVARIFLFFQMVTVFPLLMYIMRVQFMHPVFKDVYPSSKHVFLFNAVIIGVCLIFAVFLPKIGTIARFSGALCGLVYVFTLPCAIYMLHRKQQGVLSSGVVIIHAFVIVVGIGNVIGQFAILGHT